MINKFFISCVNYKSSKETSVLSYIEWDDAVLDL